MENTSSQIKKPTLAHGKAIHDLIYLHSLNPETGILPRSLKNIFENIRDFIIYEDQGIVKGCVCLHIYWDDLAEIRSLVVEPTAMKKGIGKYLVDACEKEARALRISTLFVLTKVPNFFQKLGYSLADHNSLPKGAAWGECMNCPKYPNCDEIAVLKHL